MEKIGECPPADINLDRLFFVGQIQNMINGPRREGGFGSWKIHTSTAQDRGVLMIQKSLSLFGCSLKD